MHVSTHFLFHYDIEKLECYSNYRLHQLSWILLLTVCINIGVLHYCYAMAMVQGNNSHSEPNRKRKLFSQFSGIFHYHYIDYRLEFVPTTHFSIWSQSSRKH
jgi:hypothetical protein